MELVGRLAVGVSAWLGSYELSGGELLPFAGPAIVAINHTSIADVAPVLAALYRAGLRPSRPCGGPDCGRRHGHIRFLATEVLFRHPLLGPVVRHADFVAVGPARSATAALRAGIDALRRGEVIGIYPEGDVAVDLASDGSPRPFRIGVGRLAQESGAPIVPVAHHDARLLGTGTVRESLRTAVTSVLRRPRIRIRVGPSIQPAEYAGRTVHETVSLVHERVTAVWRTTLAG
ncbi:MAG TPA: lysophospholipid acyltransferase family protein [Jiangellaceae bacterium]|nr:lysophospholipid acyltransferase family protein [Jiangellaceae bacterium]